MVKFVYLSVYHQHTHVCLDVSILVSANAKY